MKTQRRTAIRTLTITLTTIGLAITSTVGATGEPKTESIPDAATHLGRPLQDVNAVGGKVVTGSDGTPRIYTVADGDPARLIGVNANTGEVLVNLGLPGASSSYSVVATESGDVYTSTNPNGHLYRLREGATAIEDLGKVSPGQSFAWDITAGDDGRIYGSTFPGAVLYAFDPATNKFQDYGPITDASEQGKTLAVHDGKVYFGTMEPAAVHIIDTATGDKTNLNLPDELSEAADELSLFDINVSGDKLYMRIGTNIKWSELFEYDPATGKWGHSIDNVAGLELPDPGPDGEIYVMRHNALTAWDPSTGEHKETGLRYEGRVYNYRAIGWVELDDPAWPGKTLVGLFWRGEMLRYNPQTGKSELTDLGLPGEPINVLSLEGARDGGIWAGGYLGGFAHVNKDDGSAKFNRFSQTEQIVDDGETVYLGNYPDARAFAYSPDKPLNDPGYAPGPEGAERNPVPLWDLAEHKASAQDRIFDLEVTEDLVLAATGPKGVRFGGSLVLSDKQGTNVRVLDNLSDQRALTSLAEKDGVVYAGTWVYGGTGSPTPPQAEGTVLAIDIASGKVLWETTPVSGTTAFLGTTFDAAGRLWTLANGELVRIDPETGKALAKVKLTDWKLDRRPTWPDRTSAVELDATTGQLYVSVDGQLYRVTPSTGQSTPLGEFPYNNFAVLDDGSITMSKGPDLYHWAPEGVPSDLDSPAPEGPDSPTPEAPDSQAPSPGLPNTGC